MKTAISDDFPIFLHINEEIIIDRKGGETTFKQKINDHSILSFINILSIVRLGSVVFRKSCRYCL